jgi:site-specific DNA-methyltransferase (adenine-specific)
VIEPVFSVQGVDVYHGDCRAILPELPDDAFRVFITDPPYGVGMKRKRMLTDGKAVPACDPTRPRALYADDPEHVRALIADVMPLLIARARRGLMFPGANMLQDYPRPAAIGAIYCPTGAGSNSWGFTVSHALLFYGACPFQETGRGRRAVGLLDPANSHDKIIGHPCAKPFRWLRWAVERVSLPDETIVDPFAGSGTTGVAAIACGRRAILIEQEAAYLPIIRRRLDGVATPLLPLVAAAPAPSLFPEAVP